MEDSKEITPAPEIPHEDDTKSFVGSLLDFSFVSFVTPTLVRFLYAFALVCVIVLTVRWIFNGGLMDLIWRSVFSPVVLVIGAILSRVFVELIMVAFRILELLRRIDADRRAGEGKKLRVES